MGAFYIQKAQQIIPIIDAGGLYEKREDAPEEERKYIVETDDNVYMNTATGSVDFESNWIAEGVALNDLVEVEFDYINICWIEK